MRLLVLLLVLLPLFGRAQEPFRLKADFSLKATNTAAGDRLTTGTLYYDRNLGQLIYRIQFPEQATMVLTHDSILYRSELQRQASPNTAPPISSVFHLALTGQLADYGMAASNSFQLLENGRDGNYIVSTWKPTVAGKTSKVALLQLHGKLAGVIIYGPNRKPVSRQEFSGYEQFLGSSIPTHIRQELLLGDNPSYISLELSNIVLNELNEAMYVE